MLAPVLRRAYAERGPPPCHVTLDAVHGRGDCRLHVAWVLAVRAIALQQNRWKFRVGFHAYHDGSPWWAVTLHSRQGEYVRMKIPCSSTAVKIHAGCLEAVYLSDDIPREAVQAALASGVRDLCVLDRNKPIAERKGNAYNALHPHEGCRSVNALPLERATHI